MENDKTIYNSLKAVVFVGVWWGLVETTLLVWGERPAYFSWERYCIACLLLTLSSLFILALSAFPIGLVLHRRFGEKASWAIALTTPITFVVTVRILLKVISPSPRWAPGFFLKYWYVLPIFVLWLALIFFLFLNVFKVYRIYEKRIAPYVITAAALITVFIAPIIFKPSRSYEGGIKNNRPDIVLLTLDTVRDDHLASYGYFRKTTPFLDELARNSAVFDNASVLIPYTTGSHISMMTSRYPSEIGMGDVGAQLDEKIPTLAATLGKEGYLTAAFVSSFVLNGTFTKSLGFDVYDDVFSFASFIAKSHIFLALELAPGNLGFKSLLGFTEDDTLRDAESATKAAVKWLHDTETDRPLFLWVHYFDPHEINQPPPSLKTNFKATPELEEFLGKRVRLDVWEKKLKTKRNVIFEANNNYDDRLLFMDNWIKVLFDELNKIRNKPNDTYVFVLADHGFSLGEHYYFGKVAQLYDPVIQIPFFIKLPGGSAQRFDRQVDTLDLAPTILDLVGVKIAPEMRGRTLAPLLKGKEIEPRPTFSESLAHPVIFSARTPSLKLIFKPNQPKPFELYDLIADPFENNNLSDLPDQMDRTDARLLMVQLTQWVKKYHGTFKIKKAPITQRDYERLKSLGYVE